MKQPDEAPGALRLGREVLVEAGVANITGGAP